MAGTDHRQHLACTFGADLAQARGHEAVALGDHGFVEGRTAGGEFAEARLQEIALLEFFDLLALDLFVGKQAGAEAGDQLGPTPESEPAEGALERDADVAVDQRQPQAAFVGALGGGLEFGAGFDAQLFGQAALVGGQGKIGGDQAGFSLAQDLEQVEFRQRIRVGHRPVPLGIEFDRDRVVAASGDCRFDRVDAGAGNVCGAEQGVAHAVAFDDGVRLVVQAVVAGLGLGVQSRYRLSRSW